LAVGLVMALPLLASTMSDAATPSEGPRAKLRAELRVVLNDYLEARGKPEGISGVSAFVSRRDGDPGVAAAAGSTMRGGRGVPVTPERRVGWTSTRRSATGCRSTRPGARSASAAS
jgi:hypothetical protein